MSLFYFDSSALVKRYLTETGSAWVNTLTDPAAGHTIVIGKITPVEIASALAARQRAPGGITRQERDATLSLLAKHCHTEYQLISLHHIILERAVMLTQNHRLRAYDAIQLATALTVHATVIAVGLSDLTFVAADDDLIVAAQAEGLVVDNPNHHPDNEPSAIL